MHVATFDHAMARGVRLALASVVRAHPHWTLEELLEHIDGQGQLADELAGVSVREIIHASTSALHLGSTGLIDVGRRCRAERLQGEAFIEIVAEILSEAHGPVRAAYLRERAGGPRWKLLKALHELAERGAVERSGATSNTSWELVRP